tara:strand:+ start:708 stop:1136 length:429 start_codon:yes stop_codon:yes gene_type:complete
MIKYKLTCNDCDTSFDSWFASSSEYEKLKKMKHINCHECGSLKVEKSLMSPNVLNTKKKVSEIEKNKKYIKVRNKIKEYQKFIKNNFDYVGKNFAYEARSIHYDDIKKTKGIYGNATAEEVRELKEEGIETEIIPWVNDNEN